ncbi:hypothetical protein DAEQUDRAFT_764403 [Daedalea quercina L-15889]|uniref:Aip3p/Bud6 N-terminal domain-containing protein n=1 Tax=Daedalea quercina L-15889 TaxID=1314783 RepID=A0A165RJN1_9APHY|nr:hypothetical protein DAEQUDRAFT_764403 [Daedalea quercina L-15889]
MSDAPGNPYSPHLPWTPACSRGRSGFAAGLLVGAGLPIPARRAIAIRCPIGDGAWPADSKAGVGSWRQVTYLESSTLPLRASAELYSPAPPRISSQRPLVVAPDPSVLPAPPRAVPSPASPPHTASTPADCMLPFRPRPISTMQPYVQAPRQHSPSIFVRTASGEGWQRIPSPSPESPSSPLQSPSSSRPGSRDRPSSPSDVHTAVSKLLALVKQLQDVLQLWGLRQAQEEQVSNAFMLVGEQFNTTVNVLWRHKVDMRSVSPLAVRSRLGLLLALRAREGNELLRIAARLTSSGECSVSVAWSAAAGRPLQTATFIKPACAARCRLCRVTLGADSDLAEATPCLPVTGTLYPVLFMLPLLVMGALLPVTVFRIALTRANDLIRVVVRLREVLEDCLGEDPSPQVLDRYMPQVRRVVYELLVGLRSKQAPYWENVYGGQRRKTAGLEPNRQST